MEIWNSNVIKVECLCFILLKVIKSNHNNEYTKNVIMTKVERYYQHGKH